jgi:hypothetical protein
MACYKNKNTHEKAHIEASIFKRKPFNISKIKVV